MPKAARLMSALLVALTLLAGAQPAVAQETSDADLRVMTFNIRFGTAKDGINHWEHRRDLVVQIVRRTAPDIVGYQEMMPSQERYLLEQAPGYDLSGSVQELEGRSQRSESAQIAWKADRFDKLDAGMFYISRTPDQPGGDDWDSAAPRRVEWVRLVDRRADGRELFVFNTHFDHRGKQARVEGARLMRDRLEQIVGDAPVVVLGDFNSHAPTDEPCILLMAAGRDTPPRLTDAFAAAHPDASWTGTFNGFDGKPERQRRIDWVLHSHHFTPIEAMIDRTHFDGRFPSDHYPVTADLRWRER